METRLQQHRRRPAVVAHGSSAAAPAAGAATAHQRAAPAPALAVPASFGVTAVAPAFAAPSLTPPKQQTAPSILRVVPSHARPRATTTVAVAAVAAARRPPRQQPPVPRGRAARPLRSSSSSQFCGSPVAAAAAAGHARIDGDDVVDDDTQLSTTSSSTTTSTRWWRVAAAAAATPASASASASASGPDDGANAQQLLLHETRSTHTEGHPTTITTPNNVVHSAGTSPVKSTMIATAVVPMGTTSSSPGSITRTNTPRWERRVAVARAVTPMRRRSSAETTAGGPAAADGSNNSDPRGFHEQVPPPSGRRTDLMAPKRVGFWALVPYVAALVALSAAAYVGVKRFQARQRGLVEDFGEVLVFYGNSPDAKRDIVRDYKGKLGPGVLRGAMYASYLRNLVTEKPVGPAAIDDAVLVKILLRLSDAKAVAIINALGADLKSAPSLLGKLLFIAERCLAPEVHSALALVPLFPYGEGVVVELQRNMVQRCFRDLVSHALEESEDAPVPLDAARALRVDDAEASDIYDSVVAARARAREDESAVIAAAESEDASKPHVGDLDYPARSGQPAKAAVHAYQCTQCGYTMFPAAGREFKFFGEDFVCPTCGAPKDKFTDLNADAEA